MKKNTQMGFGVSLILIIVAALSVLGGGAYVATRNNANIEVDESATTTVEKKGFFDFNFGTNGTSSLTGDLNTDIETNVDVRATTETNARVNDFVDINGNTQVDLGGSVSPY